LNEIAMTEDQLAQRIYEHANAYAKSRGVKLGYGADGDFLRYARVAAVDLLKDPMALASRENEVNKAFGQVIDEMIRVSTTLPDYPPGQIGERTLERALEKLCPLFPFC
jgi:hypothetical protein